MDKKEREYMKLALELAGRGKGRVNPNPMLGAVIVKEGRIIGEGWHRKWGGLHAEREALANCSESPEGAELYVTLEPCCHWGKTPPCTEAIIKAGIKRVVAGIPDPNPLVAGKGMKILEQHGIETKVGVLEEACRRINRVFFHYIRTKKPYVVMKYAVTADGKIAAASGASKWITGETARHRVQEDRGTYSAIMVGVGTVLADDPLLTCRIPGGRNPVRIICDTRLRTPLDAQVVRTAKEVRTILATSCEDEARHREYRERGCEILKVPEKDGHSDLKKLMEALGRMGIDSVFLEGGSTLNWSATEAGIVNQVQVYLAPKLFGGKGSKSPIGGAGAWTPADCVTLSMPEITLLGEDILLEYDVLEKEQSGRR